MRWFNWRGLGFCDGGGNWGLNSVRWDLDKFWTAGDFGDWMVGLRFWELGSGSWDPMV